MQSKIVVRNRGYSRALEEIGGILREVDAAKEKKKPPTIPDKKKREKEELEKELEEDLRDIGEEEDDNNTETKNVRPR
jgi:heme oxygenase